MDYNNEIGNWIKNYSKQLYNEDYKLCVDLTYKYPIKSEKSSRKWIKNLKTYLNNKKVFIDGIVVYELDKNVQNIHNHLLVYSDVKDWKSKSLIFNYWKNIGSVNIVKYNEIENYSNYIFKYINKTKNNDWDFLINI